MSHYWEMMFEQRGERPVPHGTQVSVGTVLVLKLVEALRRTEVDFDAARAAAKAYDPRVWEAEIREAYGPAADGILAMEAHWDEIDALLAALPTSESIMALLRSLESPCLPAEIGVDGKLLKNTFLYCKEVRARYTILQLVWDLGLLDSLSDQVIAGLGE